MGPITDINTDFGTVQKPQLLELEQEYNTHE